MNKKGGVMKKDANKICILLAEDDDAIRETMCMVLESEGFECHTAKDGKEALELIGAARTLPDLLITDLMMPHVTGWELADTIHKLSRTKHIPIIVYSAVAHFAQGNPMFKYAKFIRKPVELDVLFNTIREALSGPVRDEIAAHNNQPNTADKVRSDAVEYEKRV